MSNSTQPEALPTERTQHEFTSQQNQVIENLSSAMQWIAAPLIVIAVLYAIAAVTGIVQAFQRPQMLVSVAFIILATLFYLALGIWTRRAADAFRRITTTSDQDIAHLMEALDNLRKKYSLLSVIVKLYLVLVAVMLIFMLVAWITGALRG
jgi:hypothetical protein